LSDGSNSDGASDSAGKAQEIKRDAMHLADVIVTSKPS